jgi:hypothetical protein
VIDSRGKYIVLLNPDTILLTNILQEFIEIFQANADIGIIGAKLIIPDGTLQRWSRGAILTLRSAINHYLFFSSLFPGCNFFKGIVDNVDYQRPVDVGWVSGACLAFRRELIDQISLLDETIFMYSEDMEFCYRAQQADFRVAYVPAAQVKHFVGQSFKQQQDAQILAAPLYNQGKFYQRLYGQQNLTLFRWVVWVGCLVRLGLWVLRAFWQIDHPKLIEAKRNANTALKLLLGKLTK